MNQRILIFDFDGTIADSQEKIIEILNDLAPEFGLEKVKDSDIERLRGMNTRELIKEFKVPVYKLPFIFRRFRREFAKAMPDLKPIPGIPPVIKELHDKGQVMHIVSSNTEENIRFFLQKYEIDYFGEIKGSNGLFGKHIKINRIIEAEKLLLNDVVYIGDETRDVEAGKKARVKVAAVAWGISTKEALEKEKPDYLFSKPEELLQI